MEQAYLKLLDLDEFSAVREQIEAIMAGIWASDLLLKEHDDVEVWIDEQTTELARRLLQSHLDKRSNDETVRVSLTGSDGIERDKQRVRKRDLMSLFGEVQVKRRGYGAPGTESLFPLDAELNLPGRKYSRALLRRAVDEVIKGSFDAGVRAIAKTTGGKIPKLQMEEAAVEAARDFVAFYQGRRADGPETTVDPLVLSLDGKGIVMRQDSLREATKRAAQKETHKLKTRLSRGEKRNRKRMATAAAVYSIEKHMRTAEEIMGEDEAARKTPKPRARDKRVWASVEREPQSVTEEVFEEALRRDPAKQRPWAILVDGQDQQLKNIWSSIKKHKAEHATLILDFIHVLEYLWKAAYTFYPEGSAEAEDWVQQRALLILKGKASSVAGGMRRSATMLNLSAQQREPVETCAKYLLKYAHMLRYDKYLAQGLPIASGVIEGACRHLIKDRLDITGARWCLKGAEAILQLRSLNSSGDLDAYWKFHKEKSRQEAHLSRYAPKELAA